MVDVKSRAAAAAAATTTNILGVKGPCLCLRHPTGGPGPEAPQSVLDAAMLLKEADRTVILERRKRWLLQLTVIGGILFEQGEFAWMGDNLELGEQN